MHACSRNIVDVNFTLACIRAQDLVRAEGSQPWHTYRKHLDRVHGMEHEPATLGAKSALQKRLAKRLAQQQQQQQQHAKSAAGTAAEDGALSRIADEYASMLLQEEEESKKTTQKARGKNKKKGKQQAPSADEMQKDVKSSRMAGETLDPCLTPTAVAHVEWSAADQSPETEKKSSGMGMGAGRGEASFTNLRMAASGLFSPSSSPQAAVRAVAGNEARLSALPQPPPGESQVLPSLPHSPVPKADTLPGLTTPARERSRGATMWTPTPITKDELECHLIELHARVHEQIRIVSDRSNNSAPACPPFFSPLPPGPRPSAREPPSADAMLQVRPWAASK